MILTWFLSFGAHCVHETFKFEDVSQIDLVFFSMMCIQSQVKCNEVNKFVVVWENRFLEQVKMCSERIPGTFTKL